MSDHLPRASQEPLRDYSFTHSDVSFSLPSSVFLASIAGVCVWLHPAAMILTAGGNTFCLLSFVFPPSFKPDLLPLEWPLQAPASGWKGGVNGFLFLLPSRPFPSHPVPSRPFPALSPAARITWLWQSEGKGVSNAKCLKRTVTRLRMIPGSDRSKAQGREEQKEKSPTSS